MGRKWTADQQAAIDARGGTVLVSAAAGSGKTAVLVERIIGRITDREHPVDTDRFLVVTFTRAAAAEMQDRIGKRLRELIKENPGDSFFQKQLMLLGQAQICTIDSFFGSMVRENFERLGLSPALRIVDDAMLEELRAKAAETVLEERYAAGDEGFLQLVRYFGEENDKALVNEIGELYNKIRSLPFPFLWLDQQESRYENPVPPGESGWGKLLLEEAAAAFSQAAELCRRGMAVTEQDSTLETAYLPHFAKEQVLLEAAHIACLSGDWEAAYEAAGQISFGRLNPVKKADPDLKEQAMELRKMVKAEAERGIELLVSDEAGYYEDLAALAPVVKTLFSVTKGYYLELERLKAQDNVADFNDFAYHTLSLVADGEGNPTEFARELSGNWEEILLDEYQDTNRLQDMIFRCISRKGENLFYVGDLKQSIYRFRNASPEVFAEKRDSFFPFDGEHFPASINLSMNFRSRLSVTSGINHLFSTLMSTAVGNVTYDHREQLNCGAVYPDLPEKGAVTVQILDIQKGESEDSRVLLEARSTAKLIAGMLERGEPVTENGALRPCRGGDFVILMRSQKDVDLLFAETLKKQGVDAVLSASAGYFGAREVSVMISLLRVLDNPALNIPMAAVLLSPMFRFDCDMLAALTLRFPKQSLYAALLRAEESGGTPEAAEFLEVFHRLREKSAVMRVQKLIQYIYDATGFLEVMSGFHGTAEREANLKLLLKYALDFEAGGNRELSGFVSYLDRLMEQGKDFEVANPLAESLGAVRIMTIHKSKGLEFPIVIVANCTKTHNMRDLNGTAVVDMEQGYGMKQVCRENLQSYDTVPYRAVRLSEQQNAISEEMRLLYVAMTRAKERLILNVSSEKLPKALKGAALMRDPNGQISPYVAGKGASYADWILGAFLPHPAFRPLRECYGIEVPEEEGAALQVLWTPASPEELEQEQEESPAIADEALAEVLETRFAYRYPYEAETLIPAKLSVTEIAHEELESVVLSTPAFRREKGFTPTEKGAIFHRVLQFADFQAGVSDARKELSRLVEAGFLTDLEAAVVDVKKLGAFFQSDLMKRMLKADKLLREYKFFHTIPAEEAGYPGDAPILIQGIADCVFVEDGVATVVDFKTDRVTDETALIDRYRRQLSLYQEALNPAFPGGVKTCLIYSVHLEKTISVEAVR